MKFLGIAIALLFYSIPSHAISCWKGFVETKAKMRGMTPFEVVVEQSEMVAVAEAITTFKTIARTKGEEEFLFKVVTEFDVIEILKGDLLDKVTVTNGDNCGCKYDFEPGVIYVVLASKNEGKYRTYHCKYIRPSSGSYKEVIVEVIKTNKGRQNDR